jgi:hypothetical protein
MAHTYAILDIPLPAFLLIRDRLLAAGYRDQVHDQRKLIDMQGLAIAPESPAGPPAESES